MIEMNLGTRPEWEEVLGQHVEIERIVGRSPQAVIALKNVVAYPSGFAMDVLFRRRDPDPDGADWSRSVFDEFFDPTPKPQVGQKGGPKLRMGFSDGTVFGIGAESGKCVGVKTLIPVKGTSSELSLECTYVFHPLPEPGEFWIEGEWEAVGIRRNVALIDARLLIEAGAQARSLFGER